MLAGQETSSRVMPSPPPNDLDDVRAAFRLGWALAELRGRYRPDIKIDEQTGGAPTLGRTWKALPLGNERTAHEQRIEVIRVLRGLSGQLDLNFEKKEGRKTSLVMARLDEHLRALDIDPGNKAAWNNLTEQFYEWDAHNQDALVMRPNQSAAYQLGRGLAETFWMLDPTVADANDMRSWLFLFGERRRETLARLASRLSGYMDALALPAVGMPLEAWGELAQDERWRDQVNVRPQLHAQGLLWRDLIRGERRPRDLIAGTSALGQVRLIGRLLPVLWPQLLVGAIAFCLLVVGAALLAAGAGDRGWNTALGVLGGIGLTSVGLYARAKSTAMSLLASVRDALERERVGRAANLRPKRSESALADAAASPTVDRTS
jgi:hypothetical protein